MEYLVCTTLEEALNGVSNQWPYVYILTVKGNLRHRIETLGVEEQRDNLSSDQATLAQIAVAQGFRQVQSGHDSRPIWATGAFIYCTPAHAEILEEMVDELQVQLQSKHLVCSPEHLSVLQRCLTAEASSARQGREGFLKRRAGQVREWKVVELWGCPKVDVSNVCLSQVQPDDRQSCLDLMEYLASSSNLQCLDLSQWDREVSVRMAIDCPQKMTVSKTIESPRAECVVCGQHISIKHELFSECSCHQLKNPQEYETFGGSVMRAIADTINRYPPSVFMFEEKPKG